VGNKTYYTNESLGLAVTNDTSVSVGTQAGAKIGGGYQVPDWNKDSKPITIGADVNLALIVGVKTGGTVTVDVDPVYDAGETVVDKVVAPIEKLIPHIPTPHIPTPHIPTPHIPTPHIPTPSLPPVKPPKIKKPKWMP